MLTIIDLNLDKKLSIGIALAFSSDVLRLFEAEFPDDLRPRESIESAIRWINNPSKEARNAGYADCYAAYAACYAAADAAKAAAYAAADAAYAASYAANATAAANAANAAGYAASAAAYAADAAANADAAADKERYVFDKIVKILPLILEYKIENEQLFDNAEKVLKYLNDEDKEAFLFNLDILR